MLAVLGASRCTAVELGAAETAADVDWHPVTDTERVKNIIDKGDKIVLLFTVGTVPDTVFNGCATAYEFADGKMNH